MKSTKNWMAILILLSTCFMATPLFGQAQRFLLENSDEGAWLGVRISDLDKTKVSQLKVPDENGVLIDQVEKDSPAEKAGLQPKDVIVQLNGVRVFTVRQFMRMIHELLPDRSATLTVLRNGAQSSFTAVLQKRPRPEIAWSDLGGFRSFDIPLLQEKLDGMGERLRDGLKGFSLFESSKGRLGITLQSLTPQLGEYFGVKDGRGALVVSVRKDSPADKAGIKAGDVIIVIDTREVASPSDVIAAVQSKHEGTMEIKVLREHQSKSYTVKWEEGEKQVGPSRRFPTGAKRRPLAGVRVL